MDPGIILVLDVGNTRMKGALFMDGRPVRHGTVRQVDRTSLRDLLGGTQPTVIALASVSRPDEELVAGLRDHAPVHVITGASPSPIPSRIQGVGTLGVDRLANVVAAAKRFPGRAILAVDLGTCITFDLVEPDGTHAGGAISPGLRMRARAMHTYSARLPMVDPGPEPHWLGSDTITSLEAGVHHGILNEIEGMVAKVRYHWQDAAVVLTGGDALRFSSALKSGIFALPLLTLEGLYALYQYHHTLLSGDPRLDTRLGDGPGAAG